MLIQNIKDLIRKEIGKVFDFIFDQKGGRGIDWALKHKKIKAIFPLHTQKHDEKVTDPYPSRKYVINHHCSWSGSFKASVYINEMSRTFLRYLREYLGEKIALYFAFLHFYTTWLLILSVFGVILFLYQFQYGTDNVLVPLYCFIVALWSTLMLEFWKRRQSELAFKWNMTDYEDFETEITSFATKEQEKHCGFYESHGTWVDMQEWVENVGKHKFKTVEEYVQYYHRDEGGYCCCCCWCLCTSDVYEQKEYNTRCWRFFKTMLTTSCILLMIVIVIGVMFVMLWIREMLKEKTDPQLGGLIGGALTAVMVGIFDELYEKVALGLNNLENHRTATQYEDRLIAKVFTFQFINNYFSLFYIAFSMYRLNTWCDNCSGGEESRMIQLQYHLIAMFITRMIIGNLMEWLFPRIVRNYNIWKKLRREREKIRSSNPNMSAEEIDEELAKTGLIASKVDTAERQSNQIPYSVINDVSGTFYDYSELAIQFGYVTLFAPAFPLAPLLAFITNVIENRSDGWKVLLSCRRVEYAGAEDIGTWTYVFRFLSVCAVITNCLIVAFTSDELDGYSLVTKITIIVIAEHIIFANQGFINWIVPSEPRWVRVQKGRSKEIKRVEGCIFEHEKRELARAESLRKRGLPYQNSSTIFKRKPKEKNPSDEEFEQKYDSMVEMEEKETRKAPPKSQAPMIIEEKFEKKDNQVEVDRMSPYVVKENESEPHLNQHQHIPNVNPNQPQYMHQQMGPQPQLQPILNPDPQFMYQQQQPVHPYAYQQPYVPPNPAFIPQQQPHVQQPHVQQPHVQQPHVQQPHVQQPHVPHPNFDPQQQHQNINNNNNQSQEDLAAKAAAAAILGDVMYED